MVQFGLPDWRSRTWVSGSEGHPWPCKAGVQNSDIRVTVGVNLTLPLASPMARTKFNLSVHQFPSLCNRDAHRLSEFRQCTENSAGPWETLTMWSPP